MVSGWQMAAMLARVGRGSILFASYEPREAGPLPSEQRALSQGRRMYIGSFEALWLNRHGQPCFTISDWRRLGDGKTSVQEYVTLNPETGSLYRLEIIEPKPGDGTSLLFEAARLLPKGELRELAGKLSELLQASREEEE